MNVDFNLKIKSYMAKKINRLFENGDRAFSFVDTDIMKLFDIFVKDIYGRLSIGKNITYDEAKCLLYIMYLEISKFLNIDVSKLDMLKFSFPNKEFFTEIRGVCVREAKSGKLKIFIDDKELLKLCNSDIELLDKKVLLITVAHELVHARQFQDRDNSLLNFNNFIVTLETNLAKYTKYDRENYEYLFSERCADLFGMNLYNEFLFKHDLVSLDYYHTFCESSKNVFEKEFENLFDYKVVVDGKKTDFFLGTYLLSENSKILKNRTYLFEKNSLLGLVYNYNGNLLSVSELFKKRLELIGDNEKEEIDKIYDFVFNSYFRSGNILEKLEEIKLYLENITYRDEFALMILSKYSSLYNICDYSFGVSSGDGIKIKKLNNLKKY